tara:strand:- start:314 stop:538 length:225 start_codon:yes stop_codon:yes gene_type:complete
MKKTNKQRSLQCDSCKNYFDVDKNNMYAIGMKFGVVCLDCWTKTMQELVEEQVKTKNKPERNFNLGGYDPNIWK